MVSEAQLQKAVLELARVLGYRVYHVTNVHRRLRAHSSVGFPDLVLSNTRRTLIRELKTEKGRLSQDQKEWLSVLESSGVDAGVWRPSDWLEGRIETTLLRWRGR